MKPGTESGGSAAAADRLLKDLDAEIPWQLRSARPIHEAARVAPRGVAPGRSRCRRSCTPIRRLPGRGGGTTRRGLVDVGWRLGHRDLLTFGLSASPIIVRPDARVKSRRGSIPCHPLESLLRRASLLSNARGRAHRRGGLHASTAEPRCGCRRTNSTPPDEPAWGPGITDVGRIGAGPMQNDCTD